MCQTGKLHDNQNFIVAEIKAKNVVWLINQRQIKVKVFKVRLIYCVLCILFELKIHGGAGSTLFYIDFISIGDQKL